MEDITMGLSYLAFLNCWCGARFNVPRRALAWRWLALSQLERPRWSRPSTQKRCSTRPCRS